MELQEIILRSVAGLLSLAGLSCLAVCVYWMLSAIPPSERFRLDAVRTTTVFVIGAITLTTLLYHGLRFMFSFIPPSWGSEDEYGDWEWAGTGLALAGTIVALLVLVQLCSEMEKRRDAYLQTKIDLGILQVRARDPSAMGKLRDWATDRDEAKRKLNELQVWNSRLPRSEKDLYIRGLLQAALAELEAGWPERSSSDMRYAYLDDEDPDEDLDEDEDL